ncbi:MAG: hypothetical protein JO261_06430, partial [Alphaproteobacteria bacterium]|nr:hypothetical protein [Alphaproteobacteria bacterium]
EAVATSEDGVRCDGVGCVVHARDTVIAAASRIEALAEDCASATIVISSVPADRSCRGPLLVIDRFTIERAGGYAIRLSRPLQVETVAGERGARPWSMPPPKRGSSQYRRINPTSLP